MSSKPAVTIVVTTDRYDLEWEARALQELPDLAVEFRCSAVRSEDELIDLARDAHALLVTSREPVSRRVLENLPRLRVLGRYAVGLDHLDLEAATERGVVVTHPPDYCTHEVADHAFALLLALNRRIVELDHDLRAGAWNQHKHLTNLILRGPVPALRLQTLGIVGLGRIGREMAKRAGGFGLSILAADPYLEATEIRARGAEPTTLDDLLARSDIVSLHCPLTPETRGMIDARALQRMKPSALLVNTARGPIVDLDAVVAALANGRLAGAALDVMSPEPLPLDHPLYGLPNVILTPHAAYYSERSVEVVREETLKAALDVLRGCRPRTVANPEVLARVRLSAGD